MTIPVKASVNDSTTIKILLAIIMLGAALRLYGLEIQSLSNDELSSWLRSSYPTLSQVIDEGVRPDLHPPGYHIMLYFVERYFGTSATALRFLSVIAGILSIPVMFLVGRRFYSDREGLMAALFLAVFWAPVFYSQHARSYSMLLLLSLLSVYFWLGIVTGLAKGYKVSYFVIVTYIVTAILTAYVHYFGVFLILLQGVSAVLMLLKKRRALVTVFAIYFVIMLTYLPWLPIFLYQLSTGRKIWVPASMFAVFFIYAHFLFNKSIVLLFFIFSIFGFWFLLTLLNAKRARTKLIHPSTLLLVLWLVVPITIIYFISVFSGAAVFVNRNLLISLPAAYILLARAITQLPLNHTGHAVVAVVIAVIFLGHLLFGKGYYWQPHKDQFREAVGFVVEQSETESYQNAAIIGYAWSPDYLNYYFEKKGSEQRVDMVAGQVEDIAAVTEYIHTEKPDYIWYIIAGKPPAPEFIEYLDQNYMLATFQPYINAGVWLFKTQ